MHFYLDLDNSLAIERLISLDYIVHVSQQRHIQSQPWDIKSPVAIPHASKLKSRHSGKRWIAVYRAASAFSEGIVAVFEEIQ